MEFPTWTMLLKNKNKLKIFWKNTKQKVMKHIVWKLPKMYHLNYLILAFYTNFRPIKIDLSGNTKNSKKWPIFGIFK